MTSASTAPVLTVSDDLPIRGERPVHSGKVRSVYWLDGADSRRLIAARGYDVPADTLLAVMVISDRLSAFDCLWRAESYAGVPGKGAALNAIAAHCFGCLDEAGIAGHHLLEMPHPMLWIVRQARPLRIEAIARQYLTGSLWRAYEKGEREFGGVRLEDGLARFARLPETLFTPSTKGVLRGLDGIPEYDDAPIGPAQLHTHADALGFREPGDVARCREALLRGFDRLSARYAEQGELLVDTKFEFGYVPAAGGGESLIYLDEVGTPDASRIWREADWRRGEPREYSKELFREALLSWVPQREMLLDSERMAQRSAFARAHPVPDRFFEELAATYRDMAERLTGAPLPAMAEPRQEMLDLLASLGLLR
jgi:phosphoribosylaminoimidazole-succinocarboxamide synthase